MKFRGIQNALGGTLLVGTLAIGAAAVQAQSKSNVPDAQVESNVLRQLASAPELSTQNIQSTTVYGTVTLSGTVQTEALRVRAENLAARADGVKKVVDELTLGDPGVSAQANQSTDGPGDPAQSLLAPDQQADNNAGPDPAEANMAQPEQAYGNQPPAPPQQPGYNNAYNNGPQSSYGTPHPPSYGPGAPEYQQPSQPPVSQRRPMYGDGYAPAPNYGPMGGQQSGMQVTVPSGVPLQVRINRGIDSNHIQPGTTFDGIVMNDVTAGGAVAIPRGATVQGTVVEARQAGALSGKGQLSLQITSLTLGGQTYPLVSELWDREGRDKSVTTVNSALGMGALGAIIGGVAGGGAGAAIGAAAGGAVGVAGAASSPSGRVAVPPEAVLSFRLAQPVTVSTVSQQELTRLSYAAGPMRSARPMRRYYSPYYGYYYAPAPPPPVYYRPY